MKKNVVLGSLFGDEGKGLVVQWLVHNAIKENKSVAVVRFSGGPQAAHTIYNDISKHICSTFGAGVLLGVPTYLFSQVFFDPACLYNEYRAVRMLSETDPKIYVHKDCRIITPYDIFSDKKNPNVKKDGTCGKGIHATFKRYQHETEFPKTDAITQARLYYNEYYMTDYEDFYRACLNSDLYEKFDNEFEAIKNYDVVVFEGSQGLLLDMDYGFFPHVTPSHTGLDNIKDYIQDAEVYLVNRTYLTRHGNGYTPNGGCVGCMIPDSDKFAETNVYNENQGQFKYGWFDKELLKTAFHRHHLDVWQKKYNLKYNLVTTHLDSAENLGVDMNTLYDDAIPFGMNISHIYTNDSPFSNLKLFK